MTQDPPEPHLREITDANFEAEVLNAAEPVFVDFGAAWCPPCRAARPHVAALAAAYAGRVRVGECDADANHELTARLDVRSLPTFLVFKRGRVVGQIVGAVSRAKLDALVEKGLAA
jgi:thioredoxin 1